MRTVSIVGSSYGDEGKGILTDRLAAEMNGDCIVVLFNGGAQRGHTVLTPEGQKHVFKHFGSGTFTGALTYLAKPFICNPIHFTVERRILKATGYTPKVFRHPDCMITTPYDMILNQIMESQRGDTKHGSCGMGINETVERTEKFGMFDITYNSKINDQLLRIRDKWVPYRCYQLGIDIRKIPDDLWDTLQSIELIDRYIEDVKLFKHDTEVADDDVLDGCNIIFEGGQGLMLDQCYKDFPHVTRSNTGIQNVCEILRNIGRTELEAHYVSRWYLTRHGKGPLDNECSKAYLSKKEIVDNTNIPNQWQDSLRFGLLDFQVLAENIYHDMFHGLNINVNPHIDITCMDQSDWYTFVSGREIHGGDGKYFHSYLKNFFETDTPIKFHRSDWR
jgi:adenylosuccinate synthase